MSKEQIDLQYWKKKLTEFAKDREWEQFHTPKNLAMALSVEASELVEIFQWKTELESNDVKNDSNLKKKVADELSDIFVYLLRLSTVLDIDLVTSLENKMVENAKKYPVEKVKGSAKKYSDYE